MDDKQIKSKIKETFNSEIPDVLSKIKASPAFQVPTKKNGFRINNLINKKIMITLTSVFVIALVLMVGLTRNSNVIASTVTLEINPSITISLNKRDFVVNVTAVNDDGNEVIQHDVKYKGLTVDKALEIIVGRLNELGYVVDSDDINNIILIEVSSENDEVKARIQNAFQTKLQKELEKYNKSHWVFDSEDFELTNEQVNMIKNHRLLKKMSATKLALIFRINTLDDSYTIDTLATESIRDLYDLYLSLEDEDNLPERAKMPDPKNRNGNP